MSITKNKILLFVTFIILASCKNEKSKVLSSNYPVNSIYSIDYKGQYELYDTACIYQYYPKNTKAVEVNINSKFYSLFASSCFEIYQASFDSLKNCYSKIFLSVNEDNKCFIIKWYSNKLIYNKLAFLIPEILCSDKVKTNINPMIFRKIFTKFKGEIEVFTPKVIYYSQDKNHPEIYEQIQYIDE